MENEKRDFRKEISDEKNKVSDLRSKYNDMINKYDEVKKNQNKIVFLIDSLSDSIKGPAANKIINDMKETNELNVRKFKDDFDQVKMKYENDIATTNEKIYSLEKEYRESSDEK